MRRLPSLLPRRRAQKLLQRARLPQLHRAKLRMRGLQQQPKQLAQLRPSQRPSALEARLQRVRPSGRLWCACCGISLQLQRDALGSGSAPAALQRLRMKPRACRRPWTLPLQQSASAGGARTQRPVQRRIECGVTLQGSGNVLREKLPELMLRRGRPQVLWPGPQHWRACCTA